MSKVRDPSRFQIRQRDAKKALSEGSKSEKDAIQYLIDAQLIRFGERDGVILQVPIHRVSKEHKAAMTRLVTRLMLTRAKHSPSDGELPWTEFICKRLATYQKNAQRRNLEFTLTRSCVVQLLQRCHWRCAVTGIEFTRETFGGAKAPFSPSIDRIDNSKGYTPDNTRIVCLIVNIAMNEWGSHAFLELMERCSRVRNYGGNYGG